MIVVHLASIGVHDSTVQLLIEKLESDKDAKTKDGMTALHLASTGGLDSTVQLLIERMQQIGRQGVALAKRETALYLLLRNVYASQILWLHWPWIHIYDVRSMA